MAVEQLLFPAKEDGSQPVPRPHGPGRQTRDRAKAAFAHCGTWNKSILRGMHLAYSYAWFMGKLVSRLWGEWIRLNAIPASGPPQQWAAAWIQRHPDHLPQRMGLGNPALHAPTRRDWAEAWSDCINW